MNDFSDLPKMKVVTKKKHDSFEEEIDLTNESLLHEIVDAEDDFSDIPDFY